MNVTCFPLVIFCSLSSFAEVGARKDFRSVPSPHSDHQYWWAPPIFCHFSNPQRDCCRYHVFWRQLLHTCRGWSQVLRDVFKKGDSWFRSGDLLYKESTAAACALSIFIPRRLGHFYLLVHVFMFIPILLISGC